MNDLESDTGGGVSGNSGHSGSLGHDSNSSKRADLEGEEYRDSTFYKPISSREYFKLLGYCVVGLLAVGLVFILISVLAK